MLIILLGAAFVVAGIVYLASQAIWRGRLSGQNAPLAARGRHAGAAAPRRAFPWSQPELVWHCSCRRRRRPCYCSEDLRRLQTWLFEVGNKLPTECFISLGK